ncbi:unnamed protein product [Symbiodinium necroappetens]|uniref:Uncharacterized protein n=1 Tax=Symbiodinium necroappetens TaxID=1628268 RepID=A0A812NW30_9DINO|nr:unnamed protein product [Symbiodinium necroappetens]
MQQHNATQHRGSQALFGSEHPGRGHRRRSQAMQRGSGKVGPHEQAPGMLKLTGFLLRCASASECSLKHDSSSVSVLPAAAAARRRMRSWLFELRPVPARQLPEQRAAFGCLLRGNLSAAVRSTAGLLSLFHFDAIRAKLVEDWFGSHILECHNSEGSSGGCAVTSVDRVEGLALLLAGTDWLQSAAEVPAPSAHAIHMWVMSTCTSCTIAGLLGGGTLYVDGSGYLAAKSPSGTAWQPAAGPLLNDGNFHFVAFSLGASHGEVLLADGTVLAQRSFQDAQSAGWSSPTPVKVMFGKSQTEAALGNYSGEIDVAAVFTTELSLKELRHHMLAGSWRGPGLTFAERYLTAACRALEKVTFEAGRADPGLAVLAASR